MRGNFRQKSLMFSLSSLCMSLISTLPGTCQSSDVHHPAVLQDGLNQGVIDSFGSSQFWCFTARPGNWKMVFSRSDAQEGFQLNNVPKAGCGAIINPPVQGSTLVSKDTPTGATFTGHCDKPTRVLVMIEPAKSSLVRQTNNYTLTVEGATAGGAEGSNISPGSGSSTASDNVVGVYDSYQNIGAAKLNADGSIVTTTGLTGTWTLFDASTRTYVLKIGNTQFDVSYQPARGFVDHSGTLIFTQKKVLR